MLESIERVTGTIKWFSARKGFGFVAPDDGGEDIFLHQSALEAAGAARLTEGDRIEFAVVRGDKGLSAISAIPATAELPPVAEDPRVGEGFAALGLVDPLLRAVSAEGYIEPTPIQMQAVAPILAGRDVLACAQTGTGKTAAFALPILQRLARRGPAAASGKRPIRVLVLSPTRELASQIGESFAAYGRYLGFKHATIYGSVSQVPQVAALKRGVDILVATPGRLLDLMGQGFVRLDSVETFVLDEADCMLDMGFIHDVRRVIAAVPKQRQTLLFSATLPEEIVSLARTILVDPATIAVTPDRPAVEVIEQSVYMVRSKKDKQPLLEHLLRDPSASRVLVFTRTKHGADRVVKMLGRAGIAAEPIHGNRSQSARERALANFKSGKTRVLIATDVAARGIDVEGISHVIQFDLPDVPEIYVHRIGRTARAGAPGTAWSFCLPENRQLLNQIEKLLRRRIPVAVDHPFANQVSTA
ncbi:MAG: DEAD/DEAH box helicase [Anaerolineae bacterium]